MKNISKVIAILAFGITCGAGDSMAQIIVRTRPQRPVYIRTVAPTRRHVWVDEEWTPRGNAYVFSGGRWTEPAPRGGVHWAPGHWKQKNRGSSWKRGHWYK